MGLPAMGMRDWRVARKDFFDGMARKTGTEEQATRWPGSRVEGLFKGAASYGFNAPGRSRTCNLLIRSQMLYPIELRAPVRIHFLTS